MARTKKTRTTKDTLLSTWNAGLEALASAEAEIKRQVKLLVKNKRTKDAQAALYTLAGRLAKERKRAQKELESRARSIQSRVQAEGKTLGKLVHDAVQATLASLNIPSRAEVVLLTKKVDELSHKIEGQKGKTRRRARTARAR
jgi:hypothetical protein